MEIDKKLLKILEEEGYKSICYVKGKGICAIFPFIYTVGLVVNLDKCGYEDRYCYAHKDIPRAIVALFNWQVSHEDVTGDPEDKHWIKRKGNQEYSNPNYNK